jgi:hypothetical protein
MEYIVAYYNDYINTLATVRLRTKDGRRVSHVDPDIKAQLQQKLRRIVFEFVEAGGK